MLTADAYAVLHPLGPPLIAGIGPCEFVVTCPRLSAWSRAAVVGSGGQSSGRPTATGDEVTAPVPTHIAAV
jgi:hypothetical protein